MGAGLLSWGLRCGSTGGGKSWMAGSNPIGADLSSAGLWASVMAALVAAIYDFNTLNKRKSWIVGQRPAMSLGWPLGPTLATRREWLAANS